MVKVGVYQHGDLSRRNDHVACTQIYILAVKNRCSTQVIQKKYTVKLLKLWHMIPQPQTGWNVVERHGTTIRESDQQLENRQQIALAPRNLLDGSAT